MNLNEAKNLSKLATTLEKEISKAQRNVKKGIANVRRSGDNGVRDANQIETDRDKLFKFAETHTKEEVRVYADKILSKWQ